MCFDVFLCFLFFLLVKQPFRDDLMCILSKCLKQIQVVVVVLVLSDLSHEERLSCQADRGNFQELLNMPLEHQVALNSKAQGPGPFFFCETPEVSTGSNSISRYFEIVVFVGDAFCFGCSYF